MAWKLGSSAANAHTVATVAHRLKEFPRCAAGLAEGRLSLDQLGVIAARAGEGSDERYARLVRVATVGQLRTALKCEPRPEPDPRPQPRRSITTTPGERSCCWRITLPHEEAAMSDAALASHREALISEWKHHRGAYGAASAVAPPGHPGGVFTAGAGRLGRRGGSAPTRPAHHGGGGARRCPPVRRGAASGSGTRRRPAPLPDL